MNVAVAVTEAGQVDPRWGRAQRIAVAEMADGEVRGWQVHDVGWASLHDQGSEGSHHARIATFLREHDVAVVAAEHVGPGMQRMLGSMHIRLVTGVSGDARAAVTAAAGR